MFWDEAALHIKYKNVTTESVYPFFPHHMLKCRDILECEELLHTSTEMYFILIKTNGAMMVSHVSKPCST